MKHRDVVSRPWGYYRVLHEVPGLKVKELVVFPGMSLSMQRHFLRAEHWMISDGECVVNMMMPSGYMLAPKYLAKHQEFKILINEWHQLTNPFKRPCSVIEIQHGIKCIEEDIERFELNT